MKPSFAQFFFRRRIRAVNEAQPTKAVAAINVSAEHKDGWSVVKFGVYDNAVGLQVFDQASAQAIASAFNSRSARIATLFRGEPIYIGHPDDPAWRRANPGARTEAVGRIREVKVEADGLHLRTAYNDAGRSLVEGDAPAYDAFSPHWGMVPITYQGRKAFRPVELYSIGLTNQPNIPGTFIGLNEALPPEPQNKPAMNALIKLLAALGITLAADADQAATDTAVQQGLDKIKALTDGQAAGAAAVNEASSLKTQLSASQAQVQTAVNDSATLRTALTAERAARAGLVITRAVNEGRLTEANRAEWLGKFSAQGADFAAVETELGKLKKAVNTQSQTAGLGQRRAAPTGDQGRVRAINDAVAAYKTAHPGCTHDAAYAGARAAKPELFTNDKAE